MHAACLTRRGTAWLALLPGIVAGFWPAGPVHGTLPVRYTVTSIGTLPGRGNSHGNAINGAGDVAGRATDASNGNNNRAVLFQQGSLTNLGVLPVPFALSSEALGVNDADQVVGETAPSMRSCIRTGSSRISRLCPARSPARPLRSTTKGRSWGAWRS